ncbi:hypothetical protein Tco_1299471, partial [Tanacetum coccineum]
MVKIHTDKNVADLLTKSFDVRKAKKSVKLMMEKLLRMELELILVKTINGEAQLHALVDGKKIIVTESSVRRDLQLVDEEGSAIPTDPHHTLKFLAKLKGSLQPIKDDS